MPVRSVQVTAPLRLPGMFPVEGTPRVPYTPAEEPGLASVLFPPIQIHCVVERSNFQRSSGSTDAPVESQPAPPNSQRLPAASSQLAAELRPPGVFAGAG